MLKQLPQLWTLVDLKFMAKDQVKIILKIYRNNQDAYFCSKEIVGAARKIWKETLHLYRNIMLLMFL